MNREGEALPRRPKATTIELSRVALRHHEAGASAALSDKWLADMSEAAVDLAIQPTELEQLLDAWVARRDQLRARGELELALARGQHPQLRELWWTKSRTWVQGVLTELRGASTATTREAVSVLDLDPCEVAGG